MKTIQQALIDEIFYPISVGFVENKLIERDLCAGDEYTRNVSKTNSWKGALADCLSSLLQSTNIGEGDKSVGSISSEDKKKILSRAKALYNEIGETPDIGEPTVSIGW